MLSHSPIEWTLYRFELLQGREVVSRILEIGCIPYLYLFSFINIFIIKKWKKFSILVLLINLLISIMAGGRSSFLSLLFAFGAFVNYFQFRFSSISQYTYFNISKYKKKTFKLYLVLLIISLIIASFVSSTYNNEKIEYGAKIILNRVFASADGLEYYMNYDGSKYIENGIYPFFLSIFGVYLKGTGEAEYKNIGHQLSELMTGQSLTFAHGANYTIFLQNVVLGYYWFPIYTTLIVFLVAKLRNSRNFSVVWLAISYYLYNSCFTMILDLEYYFLVVLSGFICYCLFIFPVFAIKKNHLNKF
jgi:hypothetical protein